MTSRKTFTLVACLLVAFAGMAFGDEVAEKGRAVFEANKDAVVTVRSVVSLSFGGEENERESWANGTIVDESGLTVVALSFLDPTQLFKAMGRDMGDMGSKVVSLNIVLPDGTEIPAEEAIRDKDLDLALLRPIEQPGQPMPEGGSEDWWDTWTNRAEFRPYHHELHRGWAKWWDYDGGGVSFGVTGWGTHSYDQIQRGLGTDETGDRKSVV